MVSSIFSHSHQVLAQVATDGFERVLTRLTPEKSNHEQLLGQMEGSLSLKDYPPHQFHYLAADV